MTSEPDRSKTTARQSTPKGYRVCDGLTAGLILFMVIFTPWAFGTTQPWAIWTMNVTSYTLGGVLAVKWLIRYLTGYRPPRWNDSEDGEHTRLACPSRRPAAKPFPLRESGAKDSCFGETAAITGAEPEVPVASLSEDWKVVGGPPTVTRQRRVLPEFLTTALAVLTLLILGYILISALNARADFYERERRFEYRECISWLPHSYDRASTWTAFWTYAGLACFFWATRDWLLGKSRREQSRRHEPKQEKERGAVSSDQALASMAAPLGAGSRLPARLRLLLWVLCLSGSILAVEGILQRASGSDKLLWLVQPRINKTAISQFGPYAYRSNAASYFNLVWPVCLGFWLVLRRAPQRLRPGHHRRSQKHHVLLPGAVLMAACPVISTARGGAIIAFASILAVLGLLLWSVRKESTWFRLGSYSLFGIILGISVILGWKDLAPRFEDVFIDEMSKRKEIYRDARLVADEYPVFGTGTGSFVAMYHLYRGSPDQDWAAFAHDDWLETRITFGRVGLGMILLTLGIVLARWWWGGGMPVPWEFAAMIWVALGGCLLHAKFDFPFQVYSILFAFLLLSAVLVTVSRKG